MRTRRQLGGRLALTLAAGTAALGSPAAALAAPGDLDPTFGVGGRVAWCDSPPGTYGDCAEWGDALAIQPDGRLVVAGYHAPATHPPGVTFLVRRYLPDGRRDPTFPTVVTAFGRLAARALALALQPDGKLVAAGYVARTASSSPPNEFALARYMPTGELDPAFGAGGLVTTSVGPSRRCYRPWLRKGRARWASRQAKATKWKPARLVVRRS